MTNVFNFIMTVIQLQCITQQNDDNAINNSQS